MHARRLLILALLVAGCVSAPKPAAPISSPQQFADAIGTPIEQLHDHTDASLHVGAYGLRLVNWSPLIPQELGTEGFAGMRIVNDIAYIGTDGAHAGFLVVDVHDPTAPKLLGQYKTPGGASQEAVPTSDGNYVFLNLQKIPGAPDIITDPMRGTGTGIQIIDVHDKANPVFESFFPVEVQGTHVMMYFEWQGKQYLVYNGQPTRQSLPTGDVYTPPPGDDVKIAQFMEIAGKHTLVPAGEFRLPDSITARTSQGCFPHDQWVEPRNDTKQLILYIAHWDCGAVTVDITDPTTPKLLAVENTLAPSNMSRIHYFRPDPTPRGGKVIAYSGPEIDISPGEPGTIRAYDATDPSTPKQIGWWRLPGNVENDKPFVFSPHNFDFHGDLMALAHYHAGVWLLNISDPTHPFAEGYYFPHGNETSPFVGKIWKKEPNFPEAYFPNVYEVKWHHGYILVSERGSGLYVLELAPGYRR